MSEAAERRFLSLEVALRRAPAGVTVPSPCVGVCRMSPSTGWCEGCFRTIDEIAGWSRSTDDEKVAVWRFVEARQRGA